MSPRTCPAATDYRFGRLFGLLPGGSVFVAPVDADLAAEAFRALRIRPGEGVIHDINGFGVCPAGSGIPALIFYVTTAAR